MGIATASDVDAWLKEIGGEALQKMDRGTWNLMQQCEDSKVQVNIMYTEAKSDSPPMIGVGCIFLDPPEKNQWELYKKLLELHSITQETKFCLLSNGSIMLITHRSAVDLDPSELKEMINNVVSIYNRYHKDCLSIVG
jgi:16S rRNA G966 N2-methylase RsmD